LEEKLSSGDKKQIKKSIAELSISQQLLIYDYIGILSKFDGLDKIKKAEALAMLINKSPQNIRALLTNCR